MRESIEAGSFGALRIFLRVVELGSFTAAARELGVGQPAVSTQVQKLEAALGVQLLSRTTRKVTATEAGRELYLRSLQPLRALLEAQDELRRGNRALEGTLRLALPGALGRRLAMPILLQLARAHPQITLDLRFSDQRISLAEAGIDFALRVGEQTETSLITKAVGVSTQRFVASRAYARAHGIPERLAQLSDHVLIVRPQQRAPASARQLVHVDELEAAFDAVQAGAGVAVLPSWMVANSLSQGKLVSCVHDAPVMAAKVVLVRPESAWFPRRARVFFEGLEQGLKTRFAALGNSGQASTRRSRAHSKM